MKIRVDQVLIKEEKKETIERNKILNRGISASTNKLKETLDRDRIGKTFNIDRRVYVLHAPLTSEEVTIQRRSNEPAPTLKKRIATDFSGRKKLCEKVCREGVG